MSRAGTGGSNIFAEFSDANHNGKSTVQYKGMSVYLMMLFRWAICLGTSGATDGYTEGSHSKILIKWKLFQNNYICCRFA